MAGVIRNAGHVFDYQCYPRQSPKVGWESRGCGTAQKGGFHPTPSTVVEARLTASTAGRLQGADTVTAPSMVPAARRLAADVKPVDNGGLAVTLAKELGGGETASFEPCKVATGTDKSDHASQYHTGGPLVTLLRESH